MGNRAKILILITAAMMLLVGWSCFGLAAGWVSNRVLEAGPGSGDPATGKTPYPTFSESPTRDLRSPTLSPSLSTPERTAIGALPGTMPSLTAAVPCSNSAEFVRDVTIPDGEVVAPGASLTKTWGLDNSGTCTWDESYTLVFMEGDLAGAPRTFPLSQTVVPGERLDLSIPIIAPQAPGDHYANWLLMDGSGKTFGVGPQGDWPIWVRVIVQGDQNQTDGLATPYADSPAAGICGKAEGDLATMTLLPGIPDPRCLIVHANQKLRVINRTEGTVKISLAGVTQTLEPDGSFTFIAKFSELLQPGVHALSVDPCCGGEIWLQE